MPLLLHHTIAPALILAVGCSSAPQPRIANEGTTPAPATVLLYRERHVDWAHVLGCSQRTSQIETDVTRCLALVDRNVPAMNLLGRPQQIGERAVGTCKETPGTYDIAMIQGASAPEDYWVNEVVDPRSEVIVWPPAARMRLAVQAKPDGAAFDLARATDMLRAEAIRRQPDPDLRAAVGEPRAVTVLRAELDGDGVRDEVWRVEHDEEDGSLNGVFAKLSTRAELILIRASSIYLEPVAAFDVDGDGRAELILSEHFASAFEIWLAGYTGGTFVTLPQNPSC